MGKIEPIKTDFQEVASVQAAVRQSILAVVVGRQRVGKTTLLNALIEIYRSFGANMEVWNADLHNRTHTLSMFHADALEPPAGLSMEEQRTWIETRMSGQVKHQRDVVLDVGGGLTALNLLIEEVHFVEMLEQRGIRVVLIYMMGSERADLDYLERFMEGKTFMPKATIIAYNAGLLTSGRSANTAFNEIGDHSIIRQAVLNGAEIMRMPALGCISAVTDRGLSFSDFAAGKQKEGFPETSFFDQERVWLWLHRDMVNFFLKAPQDWMPATSRPLQVSA